jgi:hypothetical protein
MRAKHEQLVAVRAEMSNPQYGNVQSKVKKDIDSFRENLRRKSELPCVEEQQAPAVTQPTTANVSPAPSDSLSLSSESSARSETPVQEIVVSVSGDSVQSVHGQRQT